jgi:hypothetical protein
MAKTELPGQTCVVTRCWHLHIHGYMYILQTSVNLGPYMYHLYMKYLS